jgi:hypothetical protein
VSLPTTQRSLGEWTQQIIIPVLIFFADVPDGGKSCFSGDWMLLLLIFIVCTGSKQKKPARNQ